jgi:hypothetical protein
MFKKLIQLIKVAFVYDEKKQVEKYLSSSKDIYELECRMRNLDKLGVGRSI